MKVDFTREAVQNALGLVSSVVPSRTPKPVLQCLRLSADKEVVNICATDLELGINYRLAQVQVGQPGEVVVPADRLSAIVRESLDEVISIEAAEATCHIRGTDSHFTIYGHDPAQYPVVPDFEGEADIEVALDALQEGIERCLFAVARETSRYAINGIFWQLKGKKLLLIGTDGRRLARSKVDVISVSSDKLKSASVIVPAKTMALLGRMSGGAKDKVAVKLVNNQIIFSCGNCVVSSNLVEGNFLKYEDIIPTDNDKKLLLSTEAVLSAVRRAALLTNEDSKGIKLAAGKDSLVFTSRAPETGDAEIDMAVTYKGEPIEIGFNPQFLIDVLRVIRTKEFELELGQTDKPGLIKSGGNLTYVVMPINLG